MEWSKRTRGRVRRAATTAVILALLATALWWLAEVGRGGQAFPKVPPGHIAILVRNSGRASPPGAIIAPRAANGEAPYQGVQEDVLPPGWYPTGYDPYQWDWEIVPQTDVPPGSVGVLVRLFGEDLAEGRILADEIDDGVIRKGVLQRTLSPGKHLVNIRAYDVLIVPSVEIASGEVGVVTRRVGAITTDPDAFLSQPGERGVQAQILPPGNHYVNPFLDDVLPISRQSQRLDLNLAGRGVRFATSDGFEIGLNGTVEWSLPEDQVPLVFVKFGRTQDTERKLILPAARAMSQMRGASQPAREFIAGATRLSFQNDFEADLRAVIEAEGPRVSSVLISNITPPEEIAGLIRARESSENQRAQFEQEIVAERSRLAFVTQTELQRRPTELAKVDADSAKKRSMAEGKRQLRLAELQAEYDTTRLQEEMARRRADQIVAEAMSRAAVTRRAAEVDAEVMGLRIAAFESGIAYSRAQLLARLASKFQTIRSGMDEPLAGVFREATGWGGDAAPESMDRSDTGGSDDGHEGDGHKDDGQEDGR